MDEDSHTYGSDAAEIAATALSLISDRGIEALSVESVAVLAGIDSKRVAAHYPDARSLIEAAILLDETRFNADVEERWAAQDAPTEQLAALLRHLVLQYDWSVWIELWSMALREEWARELRQKIDRVYHGLFVAVIARGIAAGQFRARDPAQTAIALASIVDALAVQATLGDPRVSPRFMLDTCVECASRLLDARLESPSLAATDIR